MRASLRNSRSRPLIQQIECWALETQTFPGSGLRNAVEYMGELWKRLVVFLDDPRVPLHNNSSERALRSSVIGRANYFAHRSRRGTAAAALLYSFVESAKRAGVDPSAYLDHAVHDALRGDVIPLPNQVAAKP
jgi:transposase